MTSTTHAPTSPGPQFPAGRYGRRREPRRASRWVLAVLFTAVLGVGVMIAVNMYGKYGENAYTATVESYSGVTDEQIVVTFRLYKPAGKAATCIVRARTRSGEEVGRAEVPVPSGGPDATDVAVTYTLATSRRPVIGEVFGCVAADGDAAPR